MVFSDGYTLIFLVINDPPKIYCDEIYTWWNGHVFIWLLFIAPLPVFLLNCGLFSFYLLSPLFSAIKTLNIM